MPPDIADLPIYDVASEVFEIERSAPLDSQSDIDLGEHFTEPHVCARFARQVSTELIRNYRVRDVTLDASLMLLMRGRTPLRETRYLVSDDEYAATQIKPYPLVHHDPAEHFIIGSNRAWHNYYHWLIQAVPAIDWALRQGGHLKVTLVLPPLRRWQEETLALLGCQDVARLILHPSGTYHFPSAEFSDFLGERMPGLVAPAAMATFRRLSNSVPWPRDTADAIYVARTDAQDRAMENESELIGMLERQGVRIIVPGTLSIAEQIAAFRAARLVIGPHGAGLSNIVFCQPRSLVYEMLPRFYPNAAFNRIAQMADLNYWADMFEGSASADVHGGTWRIDLDVVATRLDAIRKKLAATPRVESAMDFLRRTQAEQPDDAAPSPPRSAPLEPLSAPEPQRIGLLRRAAAAFARLLSRRR
jgi:Glycosyltransferase 61